MSEYDGLIKRLQNAAMWADKGLVILPSLVLQAADAIENLQDQLAVCMEGTKVRFVKNDDGTGEIRFENRWISATEQLPELHEEVLVCNEEYGLSGLGFATVAVWDGTDWIETWNRETAIHGVTHWMPLPELPKEETDGLNR